MKKYLVGIVYTSKNDNKTFGNGYLEMYFHGKNEKFTDSNSRNIKYFAEDYGWDRRYFAEKFMEKDKAYEEQYWDKSYAIIEIEI